MIWFKYLANTIWVLNLKYMSYFSQKGKQLEFNFFL